MAPYWLSVGRVKVIINKKTRALMVPLRNYFPDVVHREISTINGNIINTPGKQKGFSCSFFKFNFLFL